MMQEEPYICYNCKDDLHEECVGVPCMCECPDPNADKFTLATEQAIEELNL